MILTGKEILNHLGEDIIIEPFNPSNLNPNSYNLTLHNELLTYEEVVLDMKRRNRVRRITIPDSGLVLQPNRVYLGRTVEYTETHGFVPMIEGRSSVGRLGLFVHVTAGVGDVGFKGHWTLEMFAAQPIRIYPYVAICQILFYQLVGDIEEYRSEKYQNSRDIIPSLLYRELNPNADSSDGQLSFDFGTPE
jgi:dCTP deaminase